MLTSIRLRVWLAICATAIGLYLVGRWQGAASVANAAAVQNAQTALALGPTYRARLDSLRRLEQQQSGLTLIWRHRADSLRTLATRRDTVVVPDSSALGLWRATANAEHETARICAGMLQTCQERAQAAIMRAASLDSLLGNVLKIHSCHVLFVKCPSRWASLVVGGIVGALITSQVKD